MKNIFLLVFITAQISLSLQGFAQKKVKLVHADVQKGGKDYTKWVGEVIFSHEDTRIKCDSAIRYDKTNLIEAYGHVRIDEGDSIRITSNKLIYEGNNKIARLRENVVFRKLNEATLYTDFLDYDRSRQLAYYYNNGKLVDSTNTLTSEKGYYQTATNMVSFKSNVVGVSPDYTMETDTMQYNVKSNVIYFRAHTKLTDVDGTVFNHESGLYDTSQKRSNFSKGVLESESYDLTGDKLYLDDIRKYYKANDNVFLIAKEQNVIISGDIGEYWRDQQLTKIYGNAMMRKITDTDTLFLSADTLISIDSDYDSAKRLLAYKNVKLFKKDFQAKSDSLSYFLADSTIFFYQDPVLWTEENQLSADSINVVITNNTIDRLNMSMKSFVISQDTILNFNQIKGRNMTAYFKDSNLEKILVNGNGESIYFALEEEDNSIIGMNKILCSDMTIKFRDNTVEDILFFKKPDGKLIPPQELEEPDKRLQGFKWRNMDRPIREEMVLRQIFPLPNDGSIPNQDTQKKAKNNIPENQVEKKKELQNKRPQKKPANRIKKPVD
ncbi:MAG: Organic solvent tolerance protein OstA [Cyclobacteriaceae bacterium]|nr:Organic solvent tolerance protein OstA [Cyclobacteriaceae bacterium]